MTGPWAAVPLHEVVDSLDNGYTTRSGMDLEGPRYLRITDIRNGAVEWCQVPRCEIDETNRFRYQLRPGDLVFARTGATTGRSLLIRTCPEEAVFASYLIRVRPGPRLQPAFLAYYFQSPHYWRQLALQSTGSAQPGVNSSKLKRLRIPLPSLAGQRRVVETLDAHLSRLDCAAAKLERVEHNLARYRASVLKAAIDGRLVGRRSRPEAWTSCDGSSRKQDERPSLPEAWCWVRVDQLGEVVTGRTPAPARSEYYGSWLPFFKPSDLDAGQDVREARQSLSRLGAGEVHIIPEGSVLVTCIGATLGKTGLTRVQCATNQQINALIPSKDRSLPSYLYWFFSSPQGQEAIARSASSTTLPILNKSRFMRLRVPLPPLTEQARIVHELERLMTAQDRTLASVRRAQGRIARLRNTLLERAFEGACS